jgi:pyridoxal biosynthesis lyase PdxS
MVVGTKSRKYYKPAAGGIATPVEGYVIKWLDKDGLSVCVKNDGPYDNKDEAAAVLFENLKSGICSWMVKYDK